MMSVMSQSAPRLSMYSSRFRRNGRLISATDICNGHGPSFVAKGPRNLSSSPSPSPFHNQRLEQFLSRDLFLIACDMQDLTYLLDFHTRHPDRIGPIERECFEDTFVASQSALAALPQPVLGAATFNQRQHCWKMAALIYFNTGIRRWERGTGYLKGSTSRLIDALPSSDLAGAWSPFSDLLLWVLFLGYCGAQAGLEKGWFAVEIKRVVGTLSLKGVEEIASILRLFHYRPTIFQDSLHSLWEEIE